MSEDFDLIVKNQSETVTIQEVEQNLNVRFKKMNKLSSSVKANDLLVDFSYQRVVSDKKVKSIVKNFNRNAVGVVTLSIRENGDLYIIDGQHRVEALKALGKGDDDINAIIFFDLSIADEAELFVIMNEVRTRPMRTDLHKASAASGDLSSIEIDEALASLNLQIGNKPGYGIVRAISVIHKVYDALGKDKLRDVLKVLIDANGNHSSTFAAEYLLAVAAIIANYDNVNLLRLSMAIKNLGDPSMAIIKAGNSASSNKPFSKIISLASMMIDGHNYRLTKNRLDKVVILSCDARTYLNGK